MEQHGQIKTAVERMKYSGQMRFYLRRKGVHFFRMDDGSVFRIKTNQEKNADFLKGLKYGDLVVVKAE